MKTNSRLMIFGIALVAMSSCGRPNAKKQADETVEQPAFPSERNGFLLNEESFSKRFSGSMIIWQEDADAAGIAEVSRVSTAVARNGVASLKYIEKEIVPLDREFSTTYVEVEKNSIAAAKLSYDASMQAAGMWFAGDFTTQFGQIGKYAAQVKMTTGEDFPPQIIRHAVGVATSYCEAKIWERAVYKTLINEEYRMRRPTPSGMCEGIYGDLQLLKDDTPECSGGPEYKNYFACLWHQGVRKTQLWRNRYPEGDSVDLAFSKLSDESLMNAFGVDKKGPELLRQDGKLKILDLDTGKHVEIELSFLSGPLGPSSLTVQKIINLIERRPIEDDAYRFIPIVGFSPQAQELLLEANKNLRDDLKYFNLLASQGYVNENRFNTLFQKDSEVKSNLLWTKGQITEASEKFPSIMKIDTPQINALNVKIAEGTATLMGIAKIAQEKFVEIDPQASCDGKKQTLACEYKQLASAALDSVRPENVSQAVWQSAISLERVKEEGVTQSNTLLNVTSKVIKSACWSEERRETCTDALNLSEDASLAIDEKTGLMMLRIPIDDVQALGLAPLERAKLNEALGYSEIAVEDLQNLDFLLHIGINNLDDVLLTVMGEVKIVDRKSGEVKYYGSVKLRDERPPLLEFKDELIRKLMSLQR